MLGVATCRMTDIATAEQADHLDQVIVPIMEATGLDVGFLVEAATLALFDRRVYELMALWVDDVNQRLAIVRDLERVLDEYRRLQPTRPPANVQNPRAGAAISPSVERPRSLLRRMAR